LSGDLQYSRSSYTDRHDREHATRPDEKVDDTHDVMMFAPLQGGGLNGRLLYSCFNLVSRVALAGAFVQISETFH
jgi:hypothetical protein